MGASFYSLKPKPVVKSHFVRVHNIIAAPWLSWLKRLSSKQEIPSSNLGGAFLLLYQMTNKDKGKNPGGQLALELWFYGVMVSTQDSESCDPSSNLGRTYTF